MTDEERDALVTATEEFLAFIKSDAALDVPVFSLDAYTGIDNSERVFVGAVKDDEGNTVESARWDKTEHPEKDKAQMVAIARALPGKVEKDQYSDTFMLRKKFGEKYPHIRLTFRTDRSAVCTPKIVGQREEKVFNQIEVGTKVVDEIEWECTPLLR